MRRKASAVSAAVALVCLHTGMAYAQERVAEQAAADDGWRAPAASAKAHNATTANSQTLKEVTVTGERSADEKGRDDVYDKNVTTVYQGREELQRFQAANPGDVFKGMDGVYSMDTRSSQAITPNIRSISGEGRVPLTIDGTEQSTNIWLHMFGAGNRSYADPALFRSIEVEKGPSLSRGIKSGVGGAVNIRTIEPGDIIPEGKKFGMEFKADTSSNSIKPSIDANSFFGKDYKTIPGARRQDGTNVIIPTEVRNKGNGENFNFDSHSGMLAIAARNEITDFLASYSKRTQGNYFAGTKNADKYKGHDPYDKSSTDSYIPNVTKLYEAGDEVFNTASETKTTLLKNNWYLPNEQKIGLQFMRTDINFGETTPGDSVLMWGYREALERAKPEIDWANAPRFVAEKPHSEMKVDRYKIDYEFKPQGSKWLNLETSLWHTKTTGTRYQSGITPYGIIVDEDTKRALDIDEWARTEYPELMEGVPVPDHDGTIHSNGRQWTSHDRTGLDFSNQIQLASNLQLTVGGSFQREKLNDRVQKSNRQSNGFLPDGALNNMITDRVGPRAGERKEYSAMANFSYQPTPWLTLTAGTRYMRYSGKDTGIAERLRNKEEFFKAQRKLVGVELQWGEAVSPADLQKLFELSLQSNNAWKNITQADYDAIHNGVITPAWQATIDANNAMNTFTQGRQLWSPPNDGTPYWKNTVTLPVVGGKPDSSNNPFAQGSWDINEAVDGTINPWFTQNSEVEYTGKKVPKIIPITPYGEKVYQQLDAGQEWEMPEEQSGHAWSPVLSATARVGKFGTSFVRYAQTTRFPNIYELTSSTIVDGAGTLGTMAINGASKPERSINFEIGYAHNLTQFFPNLQLADARISYYNTEIKDFIDRTSTLDTIQFDKKKTSGIELQSRFDSGRFFGSLGGSYRLKQQICDKDYASSMDFYYNRIPTCITGGFPGTYSGSSLLPQYSLNMALGTRLMNERLEFGWRGVYHAGAKNKQLNGLLADGNTPGGMNSGIRDIWFRHGGVDAFYWKSVFLHDLYARFEVNKKVTLNLNVINATDEYYLDPMAKTVMPGPGRTITVGATFKF